MNAGQVSVDIQKFSDANKEVLSDILAVEEPLEIRLEYDKVPNYIHDGVTSREQKSVSITMRTPGNDFELAIGFLFTEGIIRESQDISSIEYCGPKQKHLGHSNIVKVRLASGLNLDLKSLERHFYTSSSCGVCGKASIEALKTQNQFTGSKFVGPQVSGQTLYALPAVLRQAQEVFEKTGGLHASGLFDSDGALIFVREDVGRHNALDKIIGRAFLDKILPLSHMILMVSGRVSFELVQKASMAGIKFLVAIGAPSSLALELANETDMTLVGFLKDRKFNIYSGDSRIT